jgi:hypothetical protein
MQFAQAPAHFQLSPPLETTVPGVYERQFACAYGAAQTFPLDPPELEELDELDEDPDDEPDEDPEDDPDEELDELEEDDPDEEPDDVVGASHGATHFPVVALQAHSLGQLDPHGPALTLP